MGKLIAKTAAYTLAAVIAAALILFGVVSLAAPSAMASFTDALGMDGACAYYSVEAADRSGATDDLALAAERSYAAEHYEDAAVCGTRLLGAADFADYCALRDAATAGSSLIGGSYAQYAAGITASAQYYIGEKAEALSTAMNALGGGFPQNNAVVYLVDAAQGNGDVSFCADILSALEGYSPSAEDEGEFTDFLAQLRGYCA